MMSILRDIVITLLLSVKNPAAFVPMRAEKMTYGAVGRYI
jgi:hypothetical protein